MKWFTILGKDSWQRYLLPLTFAGVDYLAVVLAEVCAVALRNMVDFWRHSLYEIPDAYEYIWVPLTFIVFLYLMHTYRQAQPVVDMIRRIFYALLNGLLASVLLLYLLKLTDSASRLFFVFFAVFALLFLYIGRYVLLKVLKRYQYFHEPVVLVGAGRTAERVLRFFDGDLGYRYNILGIIDDAPVSQSVAQQYRYLGTFAQAEKLVRRIGVATVIITAPGLSRGKLAGLIAELQPHVRNIAFVPDLIGTPMADVQVDVLFSEEILLMRLKNNLARAGNRFLKRIFDLVATVLGGVVLSPFLLALAIMVAIDNRGRVIFAHRRVGRGGREFPCYKFQTMVPDAQERLQEYLAANPEARREWEENFKLTNDPRVTKLGAFLRKTSLDELPQLWNVIVGDMSLVGPRPIVQAEVPRYHENIREYYMVRPGITGMWQASGRSDTTYEERVAMDTWYVRNWSVWIDLVYLFKTFKAVFVGKGAY